MILKVETARKPFRGHSIGIHGDDVLKTASFSSFCTKLERLGHLPLVNAIKEMAVVDKEFWPTPMSGTDLGQHQVKAENLHIGNALAALPGNVNFELRPVGRISDR